MDNIESIKAQARQYLEKRRLTKDLNERKQLFNEYSKLYFKVKYYTDEEYKKNKLQKNKEHHEGLKDNEYYLKKRNDYSREYYYNHKPPQQTQMSVF